MLHFGEPRTPSRWRGGECGGRPLGRPRISTSTPTCRRHRPTRWRSSSGRRGSQCEAGTRGLTTHTVAVVLRSDRGSQRHGVGDAPGAEDGWRSPSEATEDRNSLYRASAVALSRSGGCPQGRPRIATPVRTGAARSRSRWRSPSGATEDRNERGGGACLTAIRGAVVHRSPSEATSGSQNRGHRVRARHHGGGGRPPGRPRIATPAWPTSRRDARVAAAFRSDRGSQQLHRAVRRHEPADVAVALRGDRGSQHTGLDRRQRRQLWRSSFGVIEDRYT